MNSFAEPLRDIIIKLSVTLRNKTQIYNDKKGTQRISRRKSNSIQ